MSKWINVKDRMPPLNEHVLFIDDCKNIYTGFRENFGLDRELIRWVNKDYLTKEEDVTHWMPLPEAPNENSN